MPQASSDIAAMPVLTTLRCAVGRKVISSTIIVHIRQYGQ
jgi:hypothetical protein